MLRGFSLAKKWFKFSPLLFVLVHDENNDFFQCVFIIYLLNMIRCLLPLLSYVVTRYPLDAEFNSDETLTHLKEVELPIQPREKCDFIHKTSAHICAGHNHTEIGSTCYVGQNYVYGNR